MMITSINATKPYWFFALDEQKKREKENCMAKVGIQIKKEQNFATKTEHSLDFPAVPVWRCMCFYHVQKTNIEQNCERRIQRITLPGDSHRGDSHHFLRITVQCDDIFSSY